LHSGPGRNIKNKNFSTHLNYFPATYLLIFLIKYLKDSMVFINPVPGRTGNYKTILKNKTEEQITTITLLCVNKHF